MKSARIVDGYDRSRARHRHLLHSPDQGPEIGSSLRVRLASATQDQREDALKFARCKILSLKQHIKPGDEAVFDRCPYGQLLYATTGIVKVTTRDGLFALSGRRALWISPGTGFTVQCRGDVTLHTVHFDYAAATRTQQECNLIEVSDLLQSLILEVGAMDTSRYMPERQYLVHQLLLLEMQCSAGQCRRLPLPQDDRLAEACRYVAEDLMRNVNLNELAAIACMSRRTFTRTFRQQTGLSFATWRQQLRLLEAAERLDAGNAVTRTAYEVGYSTPGTFSAAFQRMFGVLPSQYRTRISVRNDPIPT